MFKASVLTCMLLLAGAASADAQERKPGHALQAADTNQDGVVTREEFRASRAKGFRRLDRNDDGFIDNDDLPKRRRAREAMGERVAELRRQFDTNRDGRISEEEFANGPTLAFDRADTDGNGELDSEELAAAKEAIDARRKR